MDTAIVIIPGLNTPPWAKPFEFFIEFFLKFWRFTGNNQNDWYILKNYLESKNQKVYLFDWIGALSERFGIIPEGKKLAEFIDNLPESKVILFGYSLGGVVGEFAIKHAKKNEKISKLLSVASPHRNKKINIPDSTKILNIYSDADDYIDFVNKVFYLGGFKKIDNAENIMIPDLKHSEWNINVPVQTTIGKIDLYDYYLSIIKN